VSQRQLHELIRQRGMQPVPESEWCTFRGHGALSGRQLLLLPTPVGNMFRPRRRRRMALTSASKTRGDAAVECVGRRWAHDCFVP
jgi:hypothetical protein